MLVLAFDTSSAAVTVALADLASGQVDEQLEVASNAHGELLAPAVTAVLAGRVPDAVVVGAGPGPFTGLRVGLVTAAALSSAWSVPAYSVCSLDAVPRPPGRVLVAGDARRKEVYWAVYDDEHGRVEGPHVSKPADVPVDGIDVAVGAGASIHAELLESRGVHVDHREGFPSAGLLVELARARVLAREPGDALTPLYLRRPDAAEPAAPKRVS